LQGLEDLIAARSEHEKAKALSKDLNGFERKVTVPASRKLYGMP
jgi:hypothetical protein